MTRRDRSSPVSEATTQRLSVLLRGLCVLEAEGAVSTSSRLLSERFGLNSAQIRKDLTQFGEFGVRGVGYRVALLAGKLRAVLGLDRPRPIVIAGAGNLGMALADSRNFNQPPFRVEALFDADPARAGLRSRSGVPVLPASEVAEGVRRVGAQIGILAVPADSAAGAARALVDAGVPALLNFAPSAVGPFTGVVVKNVDLTLFLEGLSYHLTRLPAGAG